MNLMSYRRNFTVSDWLEFIKHLKTKKIAHIFYGSTIDGVNVISSVLLWTDKKRIQYKDRHIYCMVNPLDVCIHSTPEGYLAIKTPLELSDSMSEEMKTMLYELAKKKIQLAMNHNLCYQTLIDEKYYAEMR